jgi:hypothetical protein
MMDDNLFPMFHKYNKLVRRGLVQPLTCDCGTPYVTSSDENADLILRCYSCNTRVTPGINTIGNVRAVVKEHFSE